MSFLSLSFFLFTTLAVIGYYRIPKQGQWIWLLVFSWLYYLAAGPGLILFLLFSITTTFFGALAAERGSRVAVPLTLLLNFGMLGILKYTGFLLGNVNTLFGTSFRADSLLLPLGISFYTFQSTGYLLDVSWKRCEPERHFFRYALFVSFFPQLMQGPIGRHARLSAELFREHAFDSAQFQRGLLRICWGLFKKLMIADYAAPFVSAIFDPAAAGSSYGVMGVLLYTAQLYADFSGGIDIVVGIGELFGITMDENFRQPFFAGSIAEFWRRWHITLGTWMKDYLFYPISLSGWMGRFGKWCRKRFGRSVGRTLPICVANVIVFLVVGIWHGPAWHFILYGLYNGILIGFSGLMEKTYRGWRGALHLREESAGFRLFRILRTFVLVNISWFFDRSETVSQAFRLMRGAWRAPFFSLSLGIAEDPQRNLLHLIVIAVSCGIVFAHSVCRERGGDPGALVLRLALPARLTLLLLFVFLIGFAGAFNNYGGFIYANF